MEKFKFAIFQLRGRINKVNLIYSIKEEKKIWVWRNII